MDKRFFRLTMVFVLCVIMAINVWAAKKIDLVSENTANYIEKLNSQVDHGHSNMGAIFGLTANEKFTEVRETKDFNSVTHSRYQQSYKGIPIWGMETVVSRDHTDSVLRINGSVAFEVPEDILNIPGTLDPKAALVKMQKQHKAKDATVKWNFINEKFGTYIYLDKNNKANLCYVVSFFTDNEKGNPSRPIFFIDVKTGKIIDSFNMLTTGLGTGPGGNQKIGQYEYGINYPGFGVTVNGSTCMMNTTNVKTVNLNHDTSGSTAYSYTCYRNTFKAINGAYCPLNDAQYFGQIIYDMYQSWYELSVLPFQLIMKVHYGSNYENAFWDGSSMTFGDGYVEFYPLVCLDVVAHEVSHGFTANNSNLIYSSQSGGINESFSDMAGEAAKYYMRGSNDFKMGYDICKSASGALRYMYDPPLDGVSIDHVSEYYPGMNVHYSSGIYNKAFYLIAVSPGWNTRMAFDIFIKANTDYWTASETFQSGGESVLQAALDYGYPCGSVVTAFATVGINLLYADFVGNPRSGNPPLTVNFNDNSINNPTSWFWNFGDSCTSTMQKPSHIYTKPGIYTVSLKVSNNNTSHVIIKSNYIIVAPPPEADFIGYPLGGVAPLKVNFSDTSTYSPTKWLWNFGDGTTSTNKNPVHTYNSKGIYTVKLTVSNASGSSSKIKTDYISVRNSPQPPVAYFTSSSPTIIKKGGRVAFINQSISPINIPVSYCWIFEGGTPASSTEKNPIVFYYTEGKFDVTLISTNAYGKDTETRLDYITVNPVRNPVPIPDED